jgi:ribose 5-phosphate isomerase B
MKIALAADHAGFELKQVIAGALEQKGVTIIDLGTHDRLPVDYPDFARALGASIVSGQADRGIIICGSGVGACVAANKIKGIRAGLCHDTYSAHQGVEHDDINVLCLGSRIIGPALAQEIVHAFLGAVFSYEDRHVRRLNKILDIEKLQH